MCKSIKLNDLKDLGVTEEIVYDPDAFRNYSKDISLLIGYLLGVKKEHLISIVDNASAEETIEKLEKDKDAKAIRHLNNIRSNIILGFKNISRSIRISSADYAPIYKHEYLENDFKELTKLNINIITGRQDLNEYLEIINREISRRINSTKNLFPDWIEFKHIVFMFNMPNNIKEECEKFQMNQNLFPYKRYFHWKHPEENGNILAYDLKLLNTIYANNNSIFDSPAKVTDASNNVKNGINDFIENGKKIQLFVDGENCDPYKLQATIEALQDYEIEKIDKIVVYYDSVYSGKAWTFLHHFALGIPVEAIAVERIKEDKSLVDHKLVAGVSKAVYKDDVDSIILASSDSDFWAVIEDVEARYLVMAETTKCGSDLKNVLREHDIFYCYIDRFIEPDDNKYFKLVFRNELEKIIEQEFNIPSPIEILNKAIMQARAEVSQTEKENLLKKYISGLTIKVNKENEFEIVIP